MPDPFRPDLRNAVEAAVPRTAPDFAGVYTRSARRSHLKWTGLGLTAAAAAALLVLAVQPPPPTPFDRQVEAFVELVYAD